MYELNLMPDVKGTIREERKGWTMMVFVCGFVVAFIAVVLLILLLIISMQGALLSAKETELICRSTGKTNDEKNIDCNRYKYNNDENSSPVGKMEDLEGLMTVQKQIEKLNLMTSTKEVDVRAMAALTSILRNDEKTAMRLSSTSYNPKTHKIDADGQIITKNSIPSQVIDAMKSDVNNTYYDYGTYKRKTDDGYKNIPSFCITEHVKNGVIYGVYHKGARGCEHALMKRITDPVDGSEIIVEEMTLSENIEIKRSYSSESEFKKAQKSDYYFESSCLTYNSLGKIDEKSTAEKCPVFAISTISLNDSSSTDDANKNSYANISVKLSLDTAFLKYQKKNVAIINKYNTVPTNASTVGSGAFQQKEDK